MPTEVQTRILTCLDCASTYTRTPAQQGKAGNPIRVYCARKLQVRAKEKELTETFGRSLSQGESIYSPLPCETVVLKREGVGYTLQDEG